MIRYFLLNDQTYELNKNQINNSKTSLNYPEASFRSVISNWLLLNIYFLELWKHGICEYYFHVY